MPDATPLSRFAGHNPKPRPTLTLQVPSRELADAVIYALMNAAEVFTVEPMAHDMWHIGVMQTGADLILKIMRSQ